MSYDPRMATFLTNLFGDNQWQYAGPNDRQADLEHMTGFDRQSAGQFAWPDRLVDVDISTGPGVDAGLPALHLFQ